MSKPIEQYSQEKIGKPWGEDDHLYLVIQLRKIDQLAQKIFDAEQRKKAVLAR